MQQTLHQFSTLKLFIAYLILNSINNCSHTFHALVGDVVVAVGVADLGDVAAHDVFVIYLGTSAHDVVVLDPDAVADAVVVIDPGAGRAQPRHLLATKFIEFQITLPLFQLACHS